MTTAVRYWRVTFTAEGKVRAVKPLKGPGHSRWVVVQADTEEEAQRKAFNLYSARKKRERIAQLDAEGRCRCGRPRDTVASTGPNAGRTATYCSTCLVRERQYHQNAKIRPNRSHAQAMAERDEGARIELNLQRQRDRKGEIRLETLVEVRNQWIKSRNVGLFGKWLEREIEALTKGHAAA